MNLKILISVFIVLVIYFSSISLSFAQIKDEITPLILLKSYQQQKNVDISNWLMSEKLDGVRAYWDGQALYSRNGNRFAAPKWFLKGFPPFELDGELWSKRGDFEQIVSIVNRQQSHNGWKALTYQIFEVPNAEGNFPQRLDKIKNYLAVRPSSHIRVIPQYSCSGELHLKSFLAEVEQLGGEGVVIRNPALPYHTGRSVSALKVKNFQDAECQVTGYKEGRGKFKGLVGAIICQTDEQKTVTIGSGLTNKEREYPPAIGTTITFKHNGFTAKGNPRFPVYLRIRKELLK